MISVDFSTEQESQALGWFADNCPNCGEVRAFLCYRLLSAWKLFGKTVNEQTVSLRVVCYLCRMAFTLPVVINPLVDTQWQPENGLQVLVDRTNSALGRVRQLSEPSGQAVLGLLRSLESQRRNFVELLEKTSGRGVALGALLGGIVFAVLGNLLVYLGPHKEQAWSGLVSIAIAPPGIAIGAICGGIIYGICIARNEIAEDLKATMRLYNIRCSHLRDALAREPNSLRKVASIVEVLCQTDADKK